MILLLAGTSDARELAVYLSQAGLMVLATVVTDSAASSLREAGIEAVTGRLDPAGFAAIAEERGASAIVDASHPFAEEASRNAMEAARLSSVPYIRFERKHSVLEAQSDNGTAPVVFVGDYAEAAEYAAAKRGVVMLTTGSKTLPVFTERLLGLEGVTLIARMLPRSDNMELCERLGVSQRHIVAMQGPFSKELNMTLFAHYGVTLMITKESGAVGSVDEKLEAAREMGIETVIIGRPEVAYGHVYNDYADILNALRILTGGNS